MTNELCKTKHMVQVVLHAQRKAGTMSGGTAPARSLLIEASLASPGGVAKAETAAHEPAVPLTA